MVSAYSVFANKGYRIEPSPILRIEDSQGNIIYKNNKTPRKVLETSVCNLITDILSDNAARAPLFGWNSVLYFQEPPKVAVKTGTTNNSVDGWTMGYTDDICIGTWTGNNDRTPMQGAMGRNISCSYLENSNAKIYSRQLLNFNWHYYVQIT